MSVSQEQSTDDKRYTNTDTGDYLSAWYHQREEGGLTTEKPLNGSVSLGDTFSLGGSGGVRDNSSVGTGVDLRGEGLVGKSGIELDWHPLVPDGSGNDVSEGTSQVVQGEVQTSDNGDVYRSALAQSWR